MFEPRISQMGIRGPKFEHGTSQVEVYLLSTRTQGCLLSGKITWPPHQNYHSPHYSLFIPFKIFLLDFFSLNITQIIFCFCTSSSSTRLQWRKLLYLSNNAHENFLSMLRRSRCHKSFMFVAHLVLVFFWEF